MRSVLVTVLAALSTSSVIAQAGGPNPDLEIAPYDLEIGDTTIEAELGTLAVRENREATDSSVIRLAFLRVPREGDGQGPPFVFLFGGPGGANVGRAGRRGPLIRELRKRGDVVLCGQRGVGRSRPLLGYTRRYALSLREPLDEKAWIEEARKAMTQSVEDAVENRDIDPGGYDTRQMCADLDELRRALGYDKIILIGGSFGSHHSLAYLRYHGQHVERALLSGLEGPNHTFKLPSNIDAHLAELSRLAKEDAKLSEKVPDLLALMRSVLERLAANPVKIKTGISSIVLGPHDLRMWTASGLGRTQFLRDLPKCYWEMSQGDFSTLAEWSMLLRRGFASRLMSDLVDGASGATRARIEQIEREAETALLGNAINGMLFHVSDLLGDIDLGDEFRSQLRTDVPILLVSGSLDARTPVSNAREILRGLSNAHHLIIDGVSHDFDVRGKARAERDRIFRAFVFDGTFPDTDRLVSPFRFTRF